MCRVSAGRGGRCGKERIDHSDALHSPASHTTATLPAASMGPKKKKGDGSEETGKPKASKLNKMNEMDRVKYLERRMAEEVEGKKRKEEMVCSFLKLKLDHEEKSVNLNRAKITDQWRNILRDLPVTSIVSRLGWESSLWILDLTRYKKGLMLH